MQKGCPDIQTDIRFMSTIIKDPDGNDFKKLGRLIRYLDNTGELVLRLSARDPLVMSGGLTVHSQFMILYKVIQEAKFQWVQALYGPVLSSRN
jgi:NifB/MoaA-like Fe-S oxidoreductase